jgi:phenylacetate-CoA ligase
VKDPFYQRSPPPADPRRRARAEAVWKLYQIVDRTQWRSPEEVQQAQLGAARQMLRHCAAHVPYYRRLFAETGIRPESITTMEEFRRLPLLTRRTYQARFEEFCAERVPRGMRATGENTTSGTSGIPVRILQTGLLKVWFSALTLRDMEWCGIDPRRGLASIRSSGPWRLPPETALSGFSRPTWGLPLCDVVVTGPSHAMCIKQDPRRQLEWLMRVNPEYLLTYPSNLEVLVRLVEETGQRPAVLRGIQAISETLTAELQARISATFGVPVFNLYSSVEAGYMTSPCPSGAGHHVHAENTLLEVLDADGRPCAPGQQGHVVFTTLHNHRTPLVRYTIGDEAVVGPEACPCGRGLPLLREVLGKRRPPMRLPDGRLRHSHDLGEAVAGVGGVLQYQCEQQAPDRLVVRVVPGRTWSADHTPRVVSAAHAFFEAPIDVRVEIVERVPLGPGGKCPSIIALPEAGGSAFAGRTSP